MTKQSLLMGAAFASATLLASPAFAQDRDEVIVTATKRATTLQETPVAVTVTTAETIKRAEILDIKDLQSVVPTLRVSQLQNSANTSLSIRGFANGSNNIGLEPSVALFIDGVFRSRAAGQISDLAQLERIEVLSGPQSTLFGKNAAAGVVSIVTSKPSYETSGYVEAGVGNYDLYRLKGYFTTGISDNAAISLEGTFQQRDGYGDIVNLDQDINNLDRFSLRGQLLFEPSDNMEWRLIADYNSLDEDCCIVASPVQSTNASIITNLLGGQLADANDPFSFETFLQQNTPNFLDDYGASLQGDIDFGFGTLTTITAYRENEHGFDQSDSDFTSLDILGNVFNDVDISTFTQEFRLTSNPSDLPFDWLIGGLYYDETIEQNSGALFGADTRLYVNTLLAGLGSSLEIVESAIPALTLGESFGNGIGSEEFFEQDNESYSIFGTVDYHVTDQLTLTGGLNYTEDRKSVTADVVNTDAFAAVNFFGADGQAGVTNATLAALAGPLAQVCGAAPSADTLTNLGAIGAAAGCNTALLPPELGFPAGILSGPQAVATLQGVAGAVGAATPLTVPCAPGQAPPACNPFAALAPVQFFLPFTNLPNAVEDARTVDDKVTWNLRAAFEVNDNINAYASVATGFKASSWALTRNSAPLAADLALQQQQGLAPNNPVVGTRFAGPEETLVYELGVKARFEKGALNVAVFDQTIDDFQSVIFQGTGFVLNNAGEQSVRGVEWDAKYLPIEPLELTIAGAYLDAEFDEFVGAGGVDGPVDLSGERPAGIPRWALSVGATYSFELSDSIDAYIRGDYDFQSDVAVIDNLPDTVRREVNQLNVSAGVEFDNGWGVRVWGRNITDDEFFTSGFPGPAQTLPPPASVNGTFNAYPNQPATYGVNVRKTF